MGRPSLREQLDGLFRAAVGDPTDRARRSLDGFDDNGTNRWHFPDPIEFIGFDRVARKLDSTLTPNSGIPCMARATYIQIGSDSRTVHGNRHLFRAIFLQGIKNGTRRRGWER